MPAAYPRHARSLASRALRQRVLVLVSVGVVIAVGSIIAAPNVMHVMHRGGASPDRGLKAVAAARNKAAEWIATWVAKDAIIACDPLMCSALQAHGVLPARIWPITSGSIDPLGSEVVVATALIRSQFGSRLTAVYAPSMLARFGSGNASIDVRVVAADGAGAYLRQLRADVLARQSAGTALLQNPRISATRPAARLLAAGRVDARLLDTLVGLVTAEGPVTILAFGGAGPGASAGMPLLSVDVTTGDADITTADLVPRRGPVTVGSARPATAKSLAGIVAFLHAQRPPLLASSVSEWRLPRGVIFVRIVFAAPTQFGMLGGSPVVTRPAG